MHGINELLRLGGPPLPEELQIGRSIPIDALHERLAAGEKLKLLEPRRVGKTCVADAAIARLRVADRPAATLDVSRVDGPASAARSLADQLSPGLAALARARRATRWLASLRDRLEGDDAATIVAERIIEVTGVVVASSEASALEQLVQPGGPLQYVGERFPLPPISREDWERTLPARFEQLDLPIDADALGRILDESREHPYCTMLLARAAARVGALTGRVTADAVAWALVEVERDEAWRLREDGA